MTRVLKGKDLLKRVMCLLLCCILLAVFFMIPHAQAIGVEVLIAKYGAEILAVILGAISGLAFGSGGELYAAADQCLMWLEKHNVPAYETVIDMATWCIGNPTKVTTTGIRVSLDLWNALVSSPLGDLLKVDAAGNKTLPVPGTAQMLKSEYYQAFSDAAFTDALGNVYTFSAGDITKNASGKVQRDFYAYKNGDLLKTVIKVTSGTDLDYALSASVYPYFYKSESSGTIYFGYSWAPDVYTGYWTTSYDGMTVNLADNAFPVTVGTSVSIPVGGDLTYPGDDFLVKAPDIPSVETDENGKEVVVVPDISVNPADHVQDLPTEDVPTDQLVDIGTGEIVDVGDVPINPDIPVTPEGTLPKPGDLTIPQLIITKFPFSIPFDVATMIGQLNAEPVAPSWRIPVKVNGMATYYITIDFTKYDTLVQILRWGLYAVFLAGLAYATRNFIKW